MAFVDDLKDTLATGIAGYTAKQQADAAAANLKQQELMGVNKDLQTSTAQQQAASASNKSMMIAGGLAFAALVALVVVLK